MSKINKRALIRFICFSFLGIFVFFVPIRINSNTAIPIDHLISLLKRLLSQFYTYIILILAVCSVVIKLKHKKYHTPSDIFFLSMTILGFLICAAVVIGVGPEEFLNVCNSAINATGNILCAVFLAAVFVPLLVEYGLVDAVGVLCRPVMRKLFLTPGSSAVIGVSAFLGNYSTGHVVAKQMYDEGKYTEKEAFIVASGFSTCSIGLMINLNNYLGISQYWGLYVLSVLVVTFATTIITSRIFPTSRKPETYITQAQTVNEEYTHSGKNIFYTAFAEGLMRAEHADKPMRTVLSILKRVYPIICEIAGTSTFVVACGLIIASSTKIFSAFGIIIYPILKVIGIDAAQIQIMLDAIGAGILEPVIAGIICEGQTLSMTAKWITAVVPYSSIVFFAGFIPSIMSSGIKCSIWELVVIWIERVFIGTVFAAIIAIMIF